MSKMPWEFSTPGTLGSPTTIVNLPTPEGRELGFHLARFADEAEAKMLAKLPDAATRCDDCAFRAGTMPNGSPITGMDAMKCLMEREPFYCHKGINTIAGEEPKRLCAGWVALTMKESGGVP